MLVRVLFFAVRNHLAVNPNPPTPSTAPHLLMHAILCLFAMDRLGGNAEFTFLPGRSHFNLYAEGDDPFALFDRIAAEMYRVALPYEK